MNRTEFLDELSEISKSIHAGKITKAEGTRRISDGGYFSDDTGQVRETAIRIAQAHQLHSLEPQVRALLDDQDHLVRKMAVAYYKIFPKLEDQMVVALAKRLQDANADIVRTTRLVFFEALDDATVERLKVTWEDHPISPWEFHAILPSPNRKRVAYYRGGEIALGSPTIGRIYCEPFKTDDGNSSMIWSINSRYLAFPIWNEDRSQSMSVFDFEKGVQGVWEKKNAVYETLEFNDEKIRVLVNRFSDNLIEEFDLHDVRWKTEMS